MKKISIMALALFFSTGCMQPADDSTMDAVIQGVKMIAKHSTLCAVMAHGTSLCVRKGLDLSKTSSDTVGLIAGNLLTTGLIAENEMELHAQVALALECCSASVVFFTLPRIAFNHLKSLVTHKQQPAHATEGQRRI